MLGGFTAAAAKVVLGVEDAGYTASLRAAEAEFAQTVGALGAQGTQLTEQSLRASRAADTYVQSLARYGPASREAQGALVGLTAEHRKLLEVQALGADANKRFGESLAGSYGRSLSFGNVVNYASNALIGGAGLIYALHAAVSAASRFQGEMTLIQTQALSSHQEVERMTQAVLRLAPALATSPDMLARGLYHVESAGIRGKAALDLLTTAAKGARLGHADLEATTNALVAAQKSGIHGAHGLTLAMGTLDAIVGSGNMRMEDLAKALSSGVISSAQGAGVSLAQLGGALSTLTVQGVPAELAATRLRYSIALLAAQTPKAEKQLKSLGMTSTQLGDTMRTQGLVPALELLVEKMKAAGEGPNTTIGERLLERAFGGGRSYSTILTLVQHIDMVAAKTQEIERQAGAFGSRWVAQTHTAEYAFKQLGVSADVLKIKIGDALLPPTVKAAQGISHWLDQGKNQTRITHDVVQGFRDAKDAADVFATGLHQLGDVLHATDQLLGGSGHTLKALLELFLLLKARNIVGALNQNLLAPLRGVPKAAKDAKQSIEDLYNLKAMPATAAGTLIARDRYINAQGQFVVPRVWRGESADAGVAAAQEQVAKSAGDAAAAEDTLTSSKTTATQTSKTQTAQITDEATAREANTQAIADETAALTDQQNLLSKIAAAPSLAPTAAPRPLSLVPPRPAPVEERLLAQQRVLAAVAAGGAVTAPQIARRLGISEAEAQQHLQSLAGGGYLKTATSDTQLLGRALAAGQRTGNLSPKLVARTLGIPEEQAAGVLAQLQAQGLVVNSRGNLYTYPRVNRYVPGEKVRSEPLLGQPSGSIFALSRQGADRLRAGQLAARETAAGGASSAEFAAGAAGVPGLIDSLIASEYDKSSRSGNVTFPSEGAPLPPPTASSLQRRIRTPRGVTTVGQLFGYNRGVASVSAAERSRLAAAAAEQAQIDARWQERLAQAQQLVIESGNAEVQMLRERLGVSTLVARALQQEVDENGLLAQVRQGAAMSADQEARNLEYGSRAAADNALAIDKLSVAQTELERLFTNWDPATGLKTYQGVLAEATAGTTKLTEALQAQQDAVTSLMSEQQRAAYNAELGFGGEDAAVRKLTADEAAQARIANAGISPRAALTSGRVSQGIRYDQYYLEQQQLASMGLIPRLRGAVSTAGRPLGWLGGVLGGEGGMQRAMGAGMLLTMFGGQLNRLPGLGGSTGNGLVNVLTGAGAGMMFAPMLGVNPWAGAAVGASFGIKHLVGGRAGSILGAMGEGAAGGALLGTMGGPLDPLTVPMGAAAGAAVGLAASLLSLGHHADATSLALDHFANLANKAAAGIAAGKQMVDQGRIALANDKVSRDQAKAALAAAEAAAKAARGTQQYHDALDRLNAARQNYHAANEQVNVDLKLIDDGHKKVTVSTQQLTAAEQHNVATLQQVATQAQNTKTKYESMGRGISQVQTTANDRVQIFIQRMQDLSEKMETSHPKLARAAADLAQIAQAANKIPPARTIAVTVKLGYDPTRLKQFEQQTQAVAGMLGLLGGEKKASALMAAEQALQAMAPNLGQVGPSPSPLTGRQVRFANGRWLGANGRPLPNQQAAWNAWVAAGHHVGSLPPAGATLTIPAAHTTTGGGGGAPAYIDPTTSGYLTHLDALISYYNAKGESGKAAQAASEEINWLWKDYQRATNDVQRKTVTDMINQLGGKVGAAGAKTARAGGGLPGLQPYLDEITNAKASGSTQKLIQAYTSERNFLSHFLAANPAGSPLHHKANQLLGQVVTELQHLNKTAAGNVSYLLPYPMQKRLGNDLQTLYAGGSDRSTLIAQRNAARAYLRERGHSPADRAQARHTLAHLNSLLANGDPYAKVIADLEADQDWYQHYAQLPSTSLPMREKAIAQASKIGRQIAMFQRKELGSAAGSLGLMGLSGRQAQQWIRLQTQYDKALQTPFTKLDDIKALQGEQTFLKQIRDKLPTAQERQVANKLLASVDDKLGKLVTAQKTLLTRLVDEFLRENQTFWSQFGSNVFGKAGIPGPTVNVHQHFPHQPTVDKAREALLAAHQARQHMGNLLQ